MKFSYIQKAFTLIEMLIVIVIIGILAAALIPRLQSVQGRARDTKRIADFRTIQDALEIYYFDNQLYPNANGPASCSTYTTVPNNAWCNSVERKSDGRWIASGALAPYITSDPIDPASGPLPLFGTTTATNLNGGTYFYYATTAAFGGCSPRQMYLLIGGMETVSNRGNSWLGCDGVTTYTAGGSYTIGKAIK